MSTDTIPPRLFTVVTSDTVNYNMDMVEYLIKQEVTRRTAAGEPRMSEWETGEYRRKLIAKLIIQGDAEGAIKLRPASTRRTLLG